MGSLNPAQNGDSDILASTAAVEGLKVIVVGGGIGGLIAAVALRQQGHDVEVFEQSRFANETGAAIHMTPNAMGVLLQLGINPMESGAVPLEQTRFFSSTNKLLHVNKFTDEAHRWQNPWLQAHRAHLHTQINTAATTKVGIGKPVILHTSSRIDTVDPQSATITLEDGRQYSGDVVVGADGVHSRSRQAIGPNIAPAFKTPHSAFRFMVERQRVLDDPETSHFAMVRHSMDMWYGPDRKIVLYPTANNTLLNFVLVHPGHLSETSHDYNQAASKDKMLSVYQSFDHSILKLLDKADPERLKVYPLFDLPTLDTFINQRLVLIGDAAHPFTPHLAQGGAQAIEDGVSVAVMLSRGVTKEEVPTRLELYMKARYERATTIQNYSRLVGGDGEGKGSSGFKIHEVIDYGFSHDEIHASTQILRQHLWKRDPSAYYWRQPTVFGPMPGPRQILGLPRTAFADQASSVEATIKFKTSGTLVRNLFPNASFAFEKRDTVVEVGFAIESFKDLAWLGGGGYDLLAFYVYNVCFTNSGGELTRGTYCPVVFENLTDPILSGREELGYPKLFSEIDISQSQGSYRAKVSWRGQEWADFQWKNLQEQDLTHFSPHKGQAPGLIVHKYIPATDREQRGKADVEYTVFIPHDGEASKTVSSRISRPADVSFKIKDLGPAKLPTLHHIASRIAELPAFEVSEGGILIRQGVSNLSTAQRIS